MVIHIGDDVNYSTTKVLNLFVELDQLKREYITFQAHAWLKCHPFYYNIGFKIVRTSYISIIC